MAATAPDALLLRRVAAGDPAALRELRLRHGPTAYAAAYTVTVDPERAEAAVAAAFSEAWRLAGQWQRRGEDVESAIRRLTREVARRSSPPVARPPAIDAP